MLATREARTPSGASESLAVELPPSAPANPAATAGSAGRRGRILRRAVPWLTVVGFLLLWEALSRAGVLGSHIPPASTVAEALRGELGSAALWRRVGETMQAWALGFGLAVAVGVPLGIVVGSRHGLYRSVRMVVDFLRPIPPVAVLPLAVLLYGTGTEMKVYLVAFSALWPILFQTLYGVQDVDPVARDTVRAYGLRPPAQFRWVLLPSASPYIATGVRLAATVALVVTIATELIVGSSGLGFAINQAQSANQVADTYALVIVAGLLGLAIAVAARAFERRLLRWHPSQRQGVAT